MTMRVLRGWKIGAAGIFLAVLGCATSGPKAPIPQSALLYLKAASEAIEAREFDKAREQIQAVKAMPRSSSLEEAIDSLETKLAGAEIADKIRKASSLKIEPERVAYGQQVLVTLEIANPGDETIRFPASQSPLLFFRERKPGGFYGRLTEIAVSMDAYGNQIRDKAERAFSLDEGVAIEPKKSWVQQTRIQIREDDPSVLRSYQLAYAIRSPRMLLGDREIASFELSVGPATFHAMPAGFEALAENPIENLKKALASEGEKFDAHVFSCAVLVGQEKRNEAVRILAGSLSDPNRARRRAVMAGLRWLTGANENGFEEDRWTAWWESRRRDYEEQASS